MPRGNFWANISKNPEDKSMSMDEYTNYRVVTYFEMIAWTPEVDMTGVSVSEADRIGGSPKLGDMIARHPVDPNDRWLISEEDFRHFYRPL
jgi:hypothetical protein